MALGMTPQFTTSSGPPPAGPPKRRLTSLPQAGIATPPTSTPGLPSLAPPPPQGAGLPTQASAGGTNFGAPGADTPSWLPGQPAPTAAPAPSAAPAPAPQTPQTSGAPSNTNQMTPQQWYERLNNALGAYLDAGYSNLGQVSGATIEAFMPGMAQSAAVLNDPYNIPEDRLTQMLENTELAYNRAGNEARQFSLSSGAGRGGVAQGVQGNIQMARGADQARNLREWEQFRTAMGDTRLATLLPQLMNFYNQSEGILRGTPAGDGGSDIADFIQAFAQIYGAAS